MFWERGGGWGVGKGGFKMEVGCRKGLWEGDTEAGQGEECVFKRVLQEGRKEEYKITQGIRPGRGERASAHTTGACCGDRLQDTSGSLCGE